MDASKLRYFRSAVRHQGFATAAQEHHVVPFNIDRATPLEIKFFELVRDLSQ